MAKGDFKKAEEYFKKAIDIDPTYVDALLAYNQLLFSVDDYEKSLPLVEAAITEGEEDPFLLWDFAVLCQKNERYSDALNAYEKAYSYLKNHEAIFTRLWIFPVRRRNLFKGYRSI